MEETGIMLSKGVFDKAHAASESEIVGYLQVLEIGERFENGISKPIVVLSDGEFKLEAYVNGRINSQFRTIVRQYDIIEPAMIMFTFGNHIKLFMLDFSRISTNIKGPLGNAIRYFLAHSSSTINNECMNSVVRQSFSDGSQIMQQAHIKTLPQGTSTIPIENLIKLKKRAGQYEDNSIYNLIHELKPHDSQWLIKARVFEKSELKACQTNQKHFFNATLRDSTGSIRVTFFKNMATAYVDQLKNGGVYTFSGGEIKHANLKFNSANHKYEIVFNLGAQIMEVEECDSFARDEIVLMDLKTVCSKNDGYIVDVLAMVVDLGEVEDVERKDSTIRPMRRAILIDHTNVKLEMTIWGEAAFQSFLSKDAIYILRKLKMRTHEENRCFQWQYNSISIPEEDIGNEFKESLETMKFWREEFIRNRQLEQNIESLEENVPLFGENESKLVFIRDLKSICSLSRASIMPLFLEFSGYIVKILSKEVFYDSCDADGCFQKLKSTNHHKYYCTKCESVRSVPVQGFSLNLLVQDDDGQIVVRISDGKILLNIFRKTMKELQEIFFLDSNYFNNLFESVIGKEFYFKEIRSMQYLDDSKQDFAVEVSDLVPIDRFAEIMSTNVRKALKLNDNK
jgi:replication factor A1